VAALHEGGRGLVRDQEVARGPSPMPPSDRRRDQRMGLSVPVRVLGHDPDGTPWEEMTTTDDASFGGASFPLKHAHGVGQVLNISAPLPRNFRRYDLAEQSYRIFALVRNTRVTEAGMRVAGVMFIGKVPPKGYETKPGGRYRLPNDGRDHERGAPEAGAPAALREPAAAAARGVGRARGADGHRERLPRRGPGLHDPSGGDGRDPHGGRPRRQGRGRGAGVQRLHGARPGGTPQPALPGWALTSSPSSRSPSHALDFPSDISHPPWLSADRLSPSASPADGTLTR